MARVVDLVETTYAAHLRRRKHPLLGWATASVGVIRGGTQPNIVPDECSIEIDRRTLPGETESGVLRELQLLLRANNLSVKMENWRNMQCLPLETDPKIPLVAEFLRNIGQREPVGVNYFCDASVLSKHGIPSVVFGPGDIAHAHTVNEWISVNSLERAREMLLRFLRSLP
jgi:acetylornithine deacetylase